MDSSITGSSNRPISQIPQSITQLSHNASFCRRNVHICPYFCYKIAPVGYGTGALWDSGDRSITCRLVENQAIVRISADPLSIGPWRNKRRWYFNLNITIFIHDKCMKISLTLSAICQGAKELVRMMRNLKQMETFSNISLEDCH